MADIDYWFSVGSTYNYLAVMQIDDVERTTGVTFRWRPFNMRTILREMNNVPFADKPVQAAYMWRDIQRRAARYGLQPRLPAPYPAKQVAFGVEVTFLGMREGWGKDFVRASYGLWFEEGVEPYVEPAVSNTLAALGQDAARVVAAAAGEENLRLLDAERIVDMRHEPTHRCLSQADAFALRIRDECQTGTPRFGSPPQIDDLSLIRVMQTLSARPMLPLHLARTAKMACIRLIETGGMEWRSF